MAGKLNIIIGSLSNFLSDRGQRRSLRRRSLRPQCDKKLPSNVNANHYQSLSNRMRNDAGFDAAVISIRIVHIDYYLLPLSDYSSSLAFQAARLTVRNAFATPKLPIVRIFGATPSGQKACLHIHGARPYMYVALPPNVSGQDAIHFASKLRHALEQALSTAYDQSTHFNQHNPPIAPQAGQLFPPLPSVSRSTYIANVEPVLRTNIYGFHPVPSLFLRISTFNPRTIPRIAAILSQGGLPDELVQHRMQPFESHLPFHLQVLTDLSLAGMAYINLATCKFRHPMPRPTPQRPQQPHPFSAVNLERRFEAGLEHLRPDLFWPFHVARHSPSELEIDAFVEDVLNARTVSPEPGSTDAQYSFASKTLRVLWDEERLRTGVMPQRQQSEPRKSIAGSGLTNDRLRGKLVSACSQPTFRSTSRSEYGGDSESDQPPGLSYQDVFQYLDHEANESLPLTAPQEQAHEPYERGLQSGSDDDEDLEIENDETTWSDIAECTQLDGKPLRRLKKTIRDLVNERKGPSTPNSISPTSKRDSSAHPAEPPGHCESSPSSGLDEEDITLKTTTGARSGPGVAFQIDRQEVAGHRHPSPVRVPLPLLVVTDKHVKVPVRAVNVPAHGHDHLRHAPDNVDDVPEGIDESGSELSLSGDERGQADHKDEAKEKAVVVTYHRQPSQELMLSHAQIVRPSSRPPSASELRANLSEQRIPNIVHQVPYYGAAADAPIGRQTFGGLMFRVPVSGVSHQESFPDAFQQQASAVETPVRVVTPVQRPPRAASLKDTLPRVRAAGSLTSRATQRIKIDSAGRQVREVPEHEGEAPPTWSPSVVPVKRRRQQVFRRFLAEGCHAEAGSDSSDSSFQGEPLSLATSSLKHAPDDSYTAINRPASPKYDERSFYQALKGMSALPVLQNASFQLAPRFCMSVYNVLTPVSAFVFFEVCFTSFMCYRHARILSTAKVWIIECSVLTTGIVAWKPKLDCGRRGGTLVDACIRRVPSVRV